MLGLVVTGVRGFVVLVVAVVVVVVVVVVLFATAVGDQALHPWSVTLLFTQGSKCLHGDPVRA